MFVFAILGVFLMGTVTGIEISAANPEVPAKVLKIQGQSTSATAAPVSKVTVK